MAFNSANPFLLDVGCCSESHSPLTNKSRHFVMIVNYYITAQAMMNKTLPQTPTVNLKTTNTLWHKLYNVRHTGKRNFPCGNNRTDSPWDRTSLCAISNQVGQEIQLRLFAESISRQRSSRWAHVMLTSSYTAEQSWFEKKTLCQSEI